MQISVWHLKTFPAGFSYFSIETPPVESKTPQGSFNSDLFSLSVCTAHLYKKNLRNTNWLLERFAFYSTATLCWNMLVE